MIKQFLKSIIPQNFRRYYQKRKERQWILGLLDLIDSKKSSNEESFFYQFSEMMKSYKRINITPYYMRHIGEMCLTWYLFIREHKNIDDTIYVLLPIFHKNRKQAPNQELFDKICSIFIVISEENVDFWRYCVKHKYNYIKIDLSYMYESMKKRDMLYANCRAERDFNIKFSNAEQEKVDTFFHRYGIENTDYICFYNRDNSYYRECLKESVKDTPDLVVRNSNVDNFRLMARNFRSKSVYSIRMGSVVEKKISGEGIIDYASESHSDLLDLYLLAHCKFFVVSGSGIQLLAKLFDTPLVIVNSGVISFGGDLVTPLSPDVDLMIIKKFYHTKENRYLSIREMLRMEAKFPSYQLFYEYDKQGIIFEENSDEEIADVAQEMWDRLNNRIYSQDEEILQERYRKILNEEIGNSSIHYYNARLGTKFLKNNPWLLR